MLSPGVNRRDFLRLAGLAALGFAVACGEERPSVIPTATAPSSPSPTPKKKASLAWRRLDAEGPRARRDHTLTGSDEGIVLLFGGRAGGDPLDDLWLYDLERARWSRVEDGGPSPRFGHNAEVVQGELIVFGGQGTGNTFFNDVWAFSLEGGSWRELDPAGRSPARRYGSSSARVGDDMYISHGFTNEGRFDDTLALRAADPDRRWSNESPDGKRPKERCLHRMASIGDRIVLFGGQTTGTAFLGDTWIFEIARKRWTESQGPGPAARNLYATGTAGDAMVVFGGLADGGPKEDVWSFDGSRWTQLEPDGDGPRARGGIEGAVVGGRMLVFGGTDGSKELDDLWELTLP